jgi:hypothetical protein
VIYGGSFLNYVTLFLELFNFLTLLSKNVTEVNYISFFLPDVIYKQAHNNYEFLKYLRSFVFNSHHFTRYYRLEDFNQF